jgi:hypothetical protein
MTLRPIALAALLLAVSVGTHGCLAVAAGGAVVGAAGAVVGTTGKVVVATGKAVIPGESRADRDKREYKDWKRQQKEERRRR